MTPLSRPLMNHPRRLLLLVPLALLGAALLVRARLPRPQTEGDKWLWEQAEKITYLQVDYRIREKAPYTFQNIVIKDRQGIRSVLRAFQGISSFRPNLVADRTPPPASFYPLVFILRTGESVSCITIFKEKQEYLLERLIPTYSPTNPDHVSIAQARINTATVARVIHALQAAKGKALQHREGYGQKIYWRNPAIKRYLPRTSHYRHPDE